MISSRVSSMINILPDKWIDVLAKKIVNHYLNKYAKIYVEDKENLKDIKRPVIFVCNHLSNSDGIVLNRVLEDEDVTFIAGVKLSNNATTNLGVHLIKTISIKPNSADKEAITKIVNKIKSGGSIFIFPEGTRSRTGQMIEAKKGILLFARLTKASIVPVGIWGSEKLLPISDSKDMSKEKFNYADVHVKFGKAFELPLKQQGEEKASYEDRVVYTIMRKIAVLLPKQYRGVYSEDK